MTRTCSLWKQVGVAASIVAISATASTAVAAQKQVNVYNWSDYIDESILADFEKETGIKVNYDVFDSNEVLETKMLTGSTGYDVVTPSASFLKRQLQTDVYLPLDQSKLPNLKNAWPLIQERTANFDAGNKHSINYMWGSTGIGYVKEKLEERMENPPVDSFDIVFNPEYAKKFADCGIHMLDAPTEIIPAALNYLGLDPNSKDKKDIKKAEALLMSVRPYIRKFHSSEYIGALANGDICLVVGWSGDVLQSRDRAAEAENGLTVDYRIPKEGTLLWFDQMAIPSDAKNVDEAHQFLNYLLRPEVIAKATNYINYANGNLASQKHIDKAVMDDPAIYPSAATMDNLFTHTADGPKYNRLMNRTWTRIKTGN